MANKNPKARLPRKDINMYVLVAGPSKAKTAQTSILFIMLGILLVLLLIAGFVAVRIYVSVLNRRVADMQATLKNNNMSEQVAQSNELAQQINTLRTANEIYTSVRSDEIAPKAQYVDDFSLDLVDRIFTCENRMTANGVEKIAILNALSYDFTSLSITAYSGEPTEEETTTEESSGEESSVEESSEESSEESDELSASRYVSYFVQSLDNLGIFDEVTYSGYSTDDVGVYNYTIDATFPAYEAPAEEESSVVDESTGAESSEEASQ